MPKPPYVELDPRYYGNIEQMQKRFEAPPSLSGCKELKIQGDVSFGKDVVCDGRVNIKAHSPVKISNLLITGDLIYE